MLSRILRIKQKVRKIWLLTLTSVEFEQGTNMLCTTFGQAKQDSISF